MNNDSTTDIERKTPEPHVWVDRLEAKMKHLEMIQSVITRITNNSFMIKGWCITLVSALLAFAVGKDGNPWLVIIAFPAVLILWYLDGYFLQQEKLFRRFYDRQTTTKNTDFQITPPKDLITNLESVSKVMWVGVLKSFYGGIFLIVLATTLILAMLRITDKPHNQKTTAAPIPIASPTMVPPQISPR